MISLQNGVYNDLQLIGLTLGNKSDNIRATHKDLPRSVFLGDQFTLDDFFFQETDLSNPWGYLALFLHKFSSDLTDSFSRV